TQIRGQFLDGFEVPGAVQFEQWKDEWRAELMPRIRDCLGREMDGGRPVGDFATVERHAEGLPDPAPLSEGAVRGRVAGRALEGRRREPGIGVRLGGAGVGKKTLTNAFVSTCQMEGAAIARAQAYDAERELPFGVLAELIKQLTVQRAIGGADPEALSELTRVSPEIFAAFPGVPKPVEWSAEVIPRRLADSFLHALEAAPADRPLLRLVDPLYG